jgi:hypothetical protein
MIILAVFRSRAHSIDYAERLQQHGVAASLVPTPKEARIGCGLCVRIDGRDAARASAIAKSGKYSSFKGFYKMDFVNGKVSLTPYFWHKQG